jgi:uncharacterized protein (DUF305 family)
MKTHLRLIAAAILVMLPATAFAQADDHHPADAATTATSTAPAPAPEATPPATPGPMPGNAPDQGANMMPMMQGNMMQMMQMMEMMQGNMMQMMQMMQGGTAQGMPAGAGGMPGGVAGMSDATKAYMNAMTTMDGPMMQGAQAADPDVAFVRAMIPHHQGAIDMAKAVLQYGKDDRVKEWANQIIKAQEAEITEMQDWLKQRPQ